MSDIPEAARRFYYGWVVVAAAFLITFVGFGAAYTFGSFATSLQSAFGASRGSVSAIFGATGFLYFAAGLVTGPLADRFGVRPLAIAGMVFVGVGMVGSGVAPTLSGVFASYVLGVGLGVGCAYVPALAAVQRWFSRQRGLASGLAVSGIGVGTLLLPPLASVLITACGWRTAYVVMGVTTSAIGVVAALLLRDDPASMGLQPDGAVASARSSALVGTPLSAAIRSAPFAVLYVGTLLTGIGAFVPFVHIVPYAVDHGVTPLRAVLLIAITGTGSTAARCVLGGSPTDGGRNASLVATTLGMSFALALWPALRDFWTLAAFALMFGAFYGGWVALLPAMVMDWFGARHLAGIIGILYSGVGIGTLIGPSAVGRTFDLTHSYTGAILGSALAGFIGAAALALAGWLQCSRLVSNQIAHLDSPRADA